MLLTGVSEKNKEEEVWMPSEPLVPHDPQLDGADEPEHEDSSDRLGAFWRSRSAASAEAIVAGVRTPLVRSVDCHWPESLSPRFRSYRSLPSGSCADVFRLDGSSVPNLKKKKRSPLTDLESSQPGGTNQQRMRTAEVLAGFSAGGVGVVASDITTTDKAPWTAWSTTESGAETPPPPAEEAMSPESRSVLSSIDETHSTSATVEPSPASFCVAARGDAADIRARFLQTASPVLNGYRYHVPGTGLGLHVSTDDPEPIQEDALCPSDSESEIEVHASQPMVEIAFEDREEEPELTVPKPPSLTLEVQLELDTLLHQLFDAIVGLRRLAARQDNPRGLLLVLLCAGFRIWQWVLNELACKLGHAGNKALVAEDRLEDQNRAGMD